MAVQRLEIVITSDVDDAIDGNKDVANSLNDVTKSIKVVLPQLDKIEKALEDISKSSRETADSLSKAFSGGGGGAGGGRGRGPKPLADDFDKLKKSTANAGQAATNFGRIISDLPYGFIAIQNNIDPLIQSLGFGAGLGLVITLLGSALTTLSQKYGGLGNAIDALNPLLSEQEKLQKQINATALEATKGAQKEIASLETLYRASQNVLLPLKDRKAAVDELQKQYPDYFKSLSDEAILAGKAAKAYDELKNAIVAKATVQAFENKIAEQGAKNAELLEKRAKLETELSQILAKRPDIIKAIQKQQDLTDVNSLTEAGNAGGTVIDRFLKIRDQLEGISKDQLKVNDATGQYKKLIDDLVKQFGTKIIIDPDTSAEKKIKTVADIIAEMNKELKAVNDQFAVTGGSGTKFANDLISVYKKAVGELSKIGVSVDTPIIGNITTEVEKLQAQLKSKSLGKVGITIPINIDASQFNNTATARIRGLADNFRNQLNDFTKAVNKIVSTNIISGIGSISEAIGEAIVSGNAGGILKAFVTSISNFLTELGTTLIATGVGIEAFKASLQSLQGGAAIAAGAALIVAAGAFRALAANSFATGGTAYGPQMAIIGDNPARKEHILSDTQLEDIAGGARWDGGQLVGVLRGQDLMIAVERAGRNERRSRG